MFFYLTSKTYLNMRLPWTQSKGWQPLRVVAYVIGSQSAPYEAPGLRWRNLGDPQAIRFFCFVYIFEIYCWDL